MAIRGRLTARIAARIPLPDVARAHTMQKLGDAAGKFILASDQFAPLP
ncbi:MAG: hypothetical protein HKN63_02750 [Rhodobacteraceae bacterium]|nr:hypothetical protein [Paracoccaceae bacterium]